MLTKYQSTHEHAVTYRAAGIPLPHSAPTASSAERIAQCASKFPRAESSNARLTGIAANSFYEKADRCQGTLLGLLFVP